MAIINSVKLHTWVAKNDKLIEKLRLDYESTTGKTMEFDDYVEYYHHQSKVSQEELPSKAELTYMCWLVDNRTFLNAAYNKLSQDEKDAKKVSKFNYELYEKSEFGEKALNTL